MESWARKKIRRKKLLIKPTFKREASEIRRPLLTATTIANLHKARNSQYQKQIKTAKDKAKKFLTNIPKDNLPGAISLLQNEKRDLMIEKMREVLQNEESRKKRKEEDD